MPVFIWGKLLYKHKLKKMLVRICIKIITAMKRKLFSVNKHKECQNAQDRVLSE